MGGNKWEKKYFLDIKEWSIFESRIELLNYASILHIFSWNCRFLREKENLKMLLMRATCD